MRTYVPVLVRGEESEGVKFWGFGKNVYQELLGFFADPDYGDLTDPVNGRDVTVEFKTAAELGKSYPETYIRKNQIRPLFLRIQTYWLRLKNRLNFQICSRKFLTRKWKIC